MLILANNNQEILADCLVIWDVDLLLLSFVLAVLFNSRYNEIVGEPRAERKRTSLALLPAAVPARKP